MASGAPLRTPFQYVISSLTLPKTSSIAEETVDSSGYPRSSLYFARRSRFSSSFKKARCCFHKQRAGAIRRNPQGRDSAPPTPPSTYCRGLLQNPHVLGGRAKRARVLPKSIFRAGFDLRFLHGYTCGPSLFSQAFRYAAARCGEVVFVRVQRERCLDVGRRTGLPGPAPRRAERMTLHLKLKDPAPRELSNTRVLICISALQKGAGSSLVTANRRTVPHNGPLVSLARSALLHPAPSVVCTSEHKNQRTSDPTSARSGTPVIHNR